MQKHFFALSVLIMVGLFSMPAIAKLNDGLEAYYPFSGNADDATGNGHHGILFGPAGLKHRMTGPDHR